MSQNLRQHALLRRTQVEALTGLKRSSIYALMKEGAFPKCVKLSVRAVAWSAEAVQAWIASRIASAGSAAAPSGNSKEA